MYGLYGVRSSWLVWGPPWGGLEIVGRILEVPVTQGGYGGHWPLSERGIGGGPQLLAKAKSDYTTAK